MKYSELKRDSNTGVSWEYCETFINSFFTNFSGGSFSNFFKKKSLKKCPCHDVLIIFSSHHVLEKNRQHLMDKNSNSFVCKFVVNCQIFSRTLSGCTLESWKLVCFLIWTILFERSFFRYLLMCLSANNYCSSIGAVRFSWIFGHKTCIDK